MKKLLLIIAILGGAAAYYFLVHPPVVLKRATAASLQEFADAVASKDRAKISAALGELLSDEAKIRLEVNFFALTGNNRPAMVQEFDKKQFIAYIDNILYPLTDYAYQSQLDQFALAADKTSAQIVFSTKQWGDGNNYYGGIAVLTRFSSEATCTGAAVMESPKPKLAQATCVLQFRSVPKPGEVHKLNNTEGLKDLLLQK